MVDQQSEAQIDQALVARALLADDRRAFEQLVRRHQGMVRAQLRRLLHGDAARADDLAQETFLLAWRKLNQFRGEARFSTWLYRIAFSCFLQSARKRQHPTDKAGGDVVGQQLSVSSEVALRLDLERAMHGLSEDEQAVLLHVAQLGLSHEEAAYVLSMPLGTVKSHARRGKDKLRASLADWQDAFLENTGHE
ncbi:MAG: sigma-70 family RNA polymerase sigma factor [Erythrobacter sp.]|nr:sigma-70 family RNA polymerase sigma factor [Erythrobacter sp.]MDZ4272881.1 sigma-70 family RNA polymerase sigma factor [Erythrobacter sp.]